MQQQHQSSLQPNWQDQEEVIIPPLHEASRL